MAEQKSGGRAGPRLDVGTLAGLLLALLGILGGYFLEHGRATQVLGESAALIVFGGTLGATLVANPLPLMKRAARRAKSLLWQPRDDKAELIDRLVAFATQARKNGIVSLEKEVLELPNSFLRKSLMLAVDGIDLEELRASMELEMDLAERGAGEEAAVYECAGGFAPTIGIIGAVLGLIIVMGDLQDMEKVGKGIAAAFIATIYGVGSANLLLLPAAHKIKVLARAERDSMELILEGVCAIAVGLNPKMIRSRLEAYVRSPGDAEAPAAADKRQRRTAA
jgi:chemotaxis protein MotA